MRVLISGASGFIGNALRPALLSAGHATAALVRHRATGDEVQWEPGIALDPARLAGFDTIVHLAGKNVAGYWSKKFKRELCDSRVQGTRTIATAVAESFRRTSHPRVLVGASAIGYYGDRSDEALTEDSPPGAGFLADLCRDWEEAAAPAIEAGVRVVQIRIGVVLARHGGALKATLPPFRLGVGGRVGDGRQFMSWITLDDVVGAFVFALSNDELRGPINAVAPQAVRNSDFVQELGKALNRPTVFPLPAFVVRTLLGEMGESLLLASARVLPTKLEAAGYRFQHPELPEALRVVLA